MLKIQEFIFAHENWRELLASAPYNLKISELDGYVLFKYNQINSDFNEPICLEARGLILDSLDNFKVVRMAFKKFFNLGESYAAKLDWSTAVATEKIDGSIMSVWFGRGGWRVSTNGSISAFDAELVGPYENFGELFFAAAKNCGLDFDKLDPHFCYTFELVSLFNKVVIAYPETTLYHLSTRDMRTLEEVSIDIGIQKPKEYRLNSEDEYRACVAAMPEGHEGIVVRDAAGQRVKIKTLLYFQLHRMANNGDITLERAVGLIKANDQAEFLSYFPELTYSFTSVSLQMQEVEEKIEMLKEWHKNWIKADFGSKTGQRKRLAMAISDFQKWEKTVVFAIHDDKLEYVLDRMTPAAYIKTFDIKWERKENE